MTKFKTIADSLPNSYRKIGVGKSDYEKFTQSLNKPFNQILEAKEEDPEADTSKLEAEIDRLDYKLYDLTDEEIAIVEEE